MAFTEPSVHRVRDIKVRVQDVPGDSKSGPFTSLHLTFIQDDEEHNAEMKVFFHGANILRAHEIADAINGAIALQQAAE